MTASDFAALHNMGLTKGASMVGVENRNGTRSKTARSFEAQRGRGTP